MVASAHHSPTGMTISGVVSTGSGAAESPLRKPGMMRRMQTMPSNAIAKGLEAASDAKDDAKDGEGGDGDGEDGDYDSENP